MSKVHVQRVSPERLREIIRQYAPQGRFLAKEGRKWVALDNSTGARWVEEFPRKRQAIRWLRGEFEVGDLAGQWARISDAKDLIRAAMQQGVILNTEEASMILGYFEGHDYCLTVNHDGRMMRHDKQYGDDHRGDEPYTVLDAIMFCQEMNDDLLHEDCSDEKYLSQLRKDEQILDELMVELMYT